jgi:LPS-assembly lipoprotein
MLAGLVGGAGLATGLSGCGMKPLYATDEGGDSVVAELSSISIPAPEDRLTQLIRNDLLSSIRPAGRGEGDRYTLELVATSRLDTTAKLNDLGADRRTVTVNVTYRLSERASSAVVYEGKTFSQVSYDETGQSFADLRARDNATERAAREVSQDIRSRLAAHFAAS